MCRKTHSSSGYSPGCFLSQVMDCINISHEIIWTNVVWRGAEMAPAGSVRLHPGTSALGQLLQEYRGREGHPVMNILSQGCGN